MAQTLSPACVGFLLAGWSVWPVVATLPALGVLVACKRPGLALGLSVLSELGVVCNHAWTALLFLGGLWLAWQPARVAQWAAAGLFAGGALLSGRGTVGLGGWLAVGAVAVMQIQEVCVKDKRGRRRPAETGQALVEFALVVTLLLMLTIGVVEFGRVFAQYLGLIYTADNLGTAAARLGGYDAVALNAVRDGNRLPLLDPDQVSYQINTTQADGTPVCASGQCACFYGQVIHLTATYPTEVRILTFRQNLDLRASVSLFCWRGGAP